MAVGFPQDQTDVFNTTYKVTLDMSGWDKTTIHVVAPVSGVIYPYASNDGNAFQGVRYGNAQLAINFQPIQVTNLATGSAVSSISAAGLYKAEVNAQFLRLQGSPGATPTNVYRLFLFNSKIQ